MVRCSAVRCLHNTGKYGSGCNSGVSFHRFPKDEERLKLWLKAVGRENWKPTKHSVLCSAHFEDTCIVHTPQNHTRLRDDAIPTKFPQLRTRRQIHTNPTQSNDLTAGDAASDDEHIHEGEIHKGEIQEGDIQEQLLGSICLQNGVSPVDTAPQAVEVIEGAVTPAPVLMAVLKMQYTKLRAFYAEERKKVKVLYQKRRRNKRRIARLKEIMSALVESNYINEDHTYL